MAAKVHAEIDPKSLADFNRAIGNLKAFASGSKSSKTRNNAGNVLRGEMKLLVKRLVDFTPPFPQQGKSGGDRAVKSDVNKVFIQPKTLGNFTNPVLAGIMQALAQRGDVAGLQAIFKTFKSGPLRSAKVLLSPDAAMHQNRRNSRGRVRPDGERALVLRGVAEYMKRTVAHVGRAKGGWNKAAALFNYNSPKWISRHGTSEGSAVDSLTQTGGFLEAVNRVPYIGGLGSRAGTLNSAIQSRTRDITKKLQAAMDYEARKFNTSR